MKNPERIPVCYISAIGPVFIRLTLGREIKPFGFHSLSRVLNVPYQVTIYEPYLGNKQTENLVWKVAQDYGDLECNAR